jgi:hypothetical protein
VIRLRACSDQSPLCPLRGGDRTEQSLRFGF